MGASKGRTFGDWNRIGRLLWLSEHKIQQEAVEALEDCAEIYMNEVENLIITGNPDWVPLSESWSLEKGHDRPYVYKGNFQDNMEIRRVRGKFRGQKIFVGASPYRHHYSGLRMDRMAQVLEGYGRPLFGPAWERAEPEIRRRLESVGADILR